jgi:hypothetical protein
MGCHQTYIPLPLPLAPSSQTPTMDVWQNTFQHYIWLLTTSYTITEAPMVMGLIFISPQHHITPTPPPPHVDFATEVLVLIWRCITSLPRHKHDVLIPFNNHNFLPHIQIQPSIDTFYLTHSYSPHHSHAPLDSPNIAISIIKKNSLVP